MSRRRIKHCCYAIQVRAPAAKATWSTYAWIPETIIRVTANLIGHVLNGPPATLDVLNGPLATSPMSRTARS
jgi:hypothetical protein